MILWKTSYGGTYWKYDLVREDASPAVDTRPDGGAVTAYVGTPIRDTLLYWLFDPKWPVMAPAMVVLEPQTQILAINAGPVINTYAGYACGTDFYWEWVAYNQIFPS